MRVQPLDEATTRALDAGHGLVVLDVALTETLLLEGLARDLVRVVQQERRQRDLNVTDRILLEVIGDERVLAALDAHRDWVAEQVLAVDVRVLPAEAGGGWHPVSLSDETRAAIRITATHAV